MEGGGGREEGGGVSADFGKDLPASWPLAWDPCVDSRRGAQKGGGKRPRDPLIRFCSSPRVGTRRAQIKRWGESWVVGSRTQGFCRVSLEGFWQSCPDGVQ